MYTLTACEAVARYLPAALIFCAMSWNFSESAATIIKDPANKVLVSMVSIWEFAIKAGLGKIKVPDGLVKNYMSSSTLCALAVNLSVALCARKSFPFSQPAARV